MHFYPYALKSRWYLADVCDTIYTSLKAVEIYTATYFEFEVERQAYLETFSRCREIARAYDMQPEKMLEELSNYHTDVTRNKIVYPFFSAARWVFDPNKAREQAVIVAFKQVDGICKRFLD